MKTPDSSVLIAAFSRWHESHEQAREAVRTAGALIGHAAIETFSVLTRLPPPRRVTPDLVAEFLAHHFPEPPVVLAPDDYGRLFAIAVEQRIHGGAVYDALIAATAMAHGKTLVTLDQRASATYRAIGVDHLLLG